MKVALALSLLLSALEAPQEKIVNGEFDFGNPAVGLFLSDGGLCTATLIGCQTVLTAAHCICPDIPGTACATSPLASPVGKTVYFQHAGIFNVSGVAVHPGYQPTNSTIPGHDIAVLRLAQPVSGVRPAEINQLGPVPTGVAGQIVGFGRIGDPSQTTGVKRRGSVITGLCVLPGHLCWTFSGQGSSTCQGDSGGPLLASTSGGDVRIIGVTSFGSNASCHPPIIIHDADVFADRAFIAAQAGADLGSRTCGGFDLGTVQGTTVAGGGTFDPIFIPANTSRLRIGANGEVPVALGFTGPSGSLTTCAGAAGQKFCEVLNPPSGNYHIHLDNHPSALAQVVVSTVAGSTTPTGPCVPGPQSLCLGANDRFRIQAAFQTGDASGTASVVKLTDETGYLWFFNANNVEAVVKVLDACALNDHFWVFAGGLTDVRVDLTVTDTQTGNIRTYTNPQGSPFQPIQDTTALPCQ